VKKVFLTENFNDSNQGKKYKLNATDFMLHMLLKLNYADKTL